MSARIVVLGKDGQLGRSMEKIAVNYPDYSFTFVGKNQLNLTDLDSIKNYFKENSFDCIVNCAAYTAVDLAESEQSLADQINHQAVKTLAEIAEQQDGTIIHISTDYVFNGDTIKPYREDDPTDPKSAYGQTKLDGENAFIEVNPNGCIIRTSWVYSEYGNNFVKTMLRLGSERDELGVIFDQVGTPTRSEEHTSELQSR